MGKYILFIIVCACFACKKKEETPAPVDTAFYARFNGKIDGVPVDVQARHQNFYPFAGRISTLNSDTDKTVYYGGIAFDAGYEHSIVAMRGPLVTPLDMVPTENNFMWLFDTGVYMLQKQQTEVIYTDSTGHQWHSRLGDQTGSIFRIAEAKSTGTPTAPRCRVVIQFSCRVYKMFSPWLYKEINDGVLTTEFSAKQE